MANGILDMFGTDFDDPRTQGLLGLSLGLLEAGGYQDRPTTLGQALARGGQVGMKYRQAALEAQEQKKAREQQQAYRELQMQQLQQQMGQRRREEAQKVQAQVAMKKMITGGRPIVSREVADDPEVQKLLALYGSAPAQLSQKLIDKQFAAPKDVPAPRAPYEIPVIQDGRQGTQLVRNVPTFGKQGQITGYRTQNIGPPVFPEVVRKDAPMPGSPYEKTVEVNGVVGEQQFQRFPITDESGTIIGSEERAVGAFVPTAEKGPELETLYTEGGGQVKGFFDPTDPRANEDGFVIVGGVKPPSGMTTTIDPATGAVTITQGPVGGMTKKITQDLQQDIVQLTGTEQRLLNIQASMRPEFLEIPTRLEAVIAKGKDKFGQASKEEKRLIAEYEAFRRNAFEALNEYIREVTGAQMSIQEAIRISRAFPKPGEGVFDGDSPTEFASKLEGAIKAIRLSRARAAYFIKEGIQPERFINPNGTQDVIYKDRQGRVINVFAENGGVTIESVMRDEEKRLKEFYSKQRGMTPDAIAANVERDLRGKFSI